MFENNNNKIYLNASFSLSNSLFSCFLSKTSLFSSIVCFHPYRFFSYDFIQMKTFLDKSFFFLCSILLHDHILISFLAEKISYSHQSHSLCMCVCVLCIFAMFSRAKTMNKKRRTISFSKTFKLYYMRFMIKIKYFFGSKLVVVLILSILFLNRFVCSSK